MSEFDTHSDRGVPFVVLCTKEELEGKREEMKVHGELHGVETREGRNGHIIFSGWIGGEAIRREVDEKHRKFTDPEGEDVKNGPSLTFGPNYLHLKIAHPTDVRPHNDVHPESGKRVTHARLRFGYPVFFLDEVHRQDPTALPEVINQLTTFSQEGLLGPEHVVLAEYAVQKLGEIIDPPAV